MASGSQYYAVRDPNTGDVYWVTEDAYAASLQEGYVAAGATPQGIYDPAAAQVAAAAKFGLDAANAATTRFGAQAQAAAAMGQLLMQGVTDNPFQYAQLALGGDASSLGLYNEIADGRGYGQLRPGEQKPFDTQRLTKPGAFGDFKTGRTSAEVNTTQGTVSTAGGNAQPYTATPGGTRVSTPGLTGGQVTGQGAAGAIQAPVGGAARQGGANPYASGTPAGGAPSSGTAAAPAAYVRPTNAQFSGFGALDGSRAEIPGKGDSSPSWKRERQSWLDKNGYGHSGGKDEAKAKLGYGDAGGEAEFNKFFKRGKQPQQATRTPGMAQGGALMANVRPSPAGLPGGPGQQYGSKPALPPNPFTTMRGAETAHPALPPGNYPGGGGGAMSSGYPEMTSPAVAGGELGGISGETGHHPDISYSGLNPYGGEPVRAHTPAAGGGGGGGYGGGGGGGGGGVPRYAQAAAGPDPRLVKIATRWYMHQFGGDVPSDFNQAMQAFLADDPAYVRNALGMAQAGQIQQILGLDANGDPIGAPQAQMQLTPQAEYGGGIGYPSGGDTPGGAPLPPGYSMVNGLPVGGRVTNSSTRPAPHFATGGALMADGRPGLQHLLGGLGGGGEEGMGDRPMDDGAGGAELGGDPNAGGGGGLDLANARMQVVQSPQTVTVGENGDAELLVVIPLQRRGTAVPPWAAAAASQITGNDYRPQPGREPPGLDYNGDGQTGATPHMAAGGAIYGAGGGGSVYGYGQSSVRAAPTPSRTGQVSVPGSKRGMKKVAVNSPFPAPNDADPFGIDTILQNPFLQTLAQSGMRRQGIVPEDYFARAIYSRPRQNPGGGFGLSGM